MLLRASTLGRRFPRTATNPNRQHERVGDFVFDPRVFILPPFRSCPNCRRADTYGVLMIGGVQYTRRCRECWHTDHYALPPLEKVIS